MATQPNTHIIRPEHLKKFMQAGKALLTVQSVATGAHFTYKVRKDPDKDLWYVSVLTGPDNSKAYQYIGTITDKFKHSPKSRIKEGAKSVKGFAWLWWNVDNFDKLAQQTSIQHCGYCCKCGRLLTTPESIVAGIGPKCATLQNY